MHAGRGIILVWIIQQEVSSVRQGYQVINYIVIFVLTAYDSLVSTTITYIFLKVAGFIRQVSNDSVQSGYVNSILQSWLRCKLIKILPLPSRRYIFGGLISRRLIWCLFQ